MEVKKLVSFTLPYPVNVSVNKCYIKSKSGIFLSAKARAYRSIVNLICLNIFRFEKSFINVSINMYVPDDRRRDVDNILKTVLDSLQHAGIYDDDSQIQKLSVEKKGKFAGGRLDITISTI